MPPPTLPTALAPRRSRRARRARSAQPALLVALLLPACVLLSQATLAAAQTSAFRGPFLKLTDDPCRSQADCHPDLRCRLLRANEPPAPCNPLENESCSCAPPDGKYRRCTRSTDCPPHERCISRGGDPGKRARCSSCSAFFMIARNVTQPVDDTAAICPSPTPTPTPKGFTLDECDPSRPAPCRAPATCARFVDSALVVCKPGDTECDCQPRQTHQCETSRECRRGERCAARGFDGQRPFLCVSCVVAENNPHVFRFADLHAPSCDEALVPAHTPPPPPAPSAPTPRPHHCPESAGLTLDHCCGGESGACFFPRRCISVSSRAQCRVGEVGCVCLSVADGSCKSSTDCTSGERCVGAPGRTSCVSCSRVAAMKLFVLVDDGKGNCDDAPVYPMPHVPEYPTPPPVGPGAPQALDGDDQRPAAQALDATDEPQPSGDPLVQAGDDGDGAGDASAARDMPSPAAAESEQPQPSDEATGPSPEASPPASPTPAGGESANATSEAVCIGAHHLASLPRAALVFRAHAHARVLCDAHGSCATPGHMVVWRGAPMSMRSYCTARRAAGGGPCAPAAMAVNSVRMRRGVRVASRTEGLQFTALAARWATPVEERLLAALVRVGV